MREKMRERTTSYSESIKSLKDYYRDQGTPVEEHDKVTMFLHGEYQTTYEEVTDQFADLLQRFPDISFLYVKQQIHGEYGVKSLCTIIQDQDEMIEISAMINLWNESVIPRFHFSPSIRILNKKYPDKYQNITTAIRQAIHQHPAYGVDPSSTAIETFHDWVALVKKSPEYNQYQVIDESDAYLFLQQEKAIIRYEYREKMTTELIKQLNIPLVVMRVQTEDSTMSPTERYELLFSHRNQLMKASIQTKTGEEFSNFVLSVQYLSDRGIEENLYYECDLDELQHQFDKQVKALPEFRLHVVTGNIKKP